MSLFTKKPWPLALLLLLLAVIPLVAILVIVDRAATTSLRERVINGQFAIGHILAQDAEREIARIDNQVQHSANHLGLRIALTSRRYDRVRQLIDEFGRQGDYIVRVAAYDSRGRAVAYHPLNRPAMPRGGGARSIQEATARVSNQRALFVLTAPIEAPPDEPRGSVGELIYEIDLTAAMPDIAETKIGETGTMTLALADGTVLASGSPEKRGRVLSELIRHSGSDHKSGDQYEIQGLNSPATDNREIGSITSLDTGWYVAVTQDESEAFAPLDDLRVTILAGGLVIVLMGALSSLLLARRVNRAQESLIQSETRARQITDLSHLAFFAINTSGKITAWNPAASILFGWSKDESLGEQLVDRIKPRESENELLRKLMVASTGMSSLELQGRNRSGERLELDVSATAHFADDDPEIFAFIRDISVRKQLEQAQLDTQKKLEAANKELLNAGELKSDFLAMASHELRTPVTSIFGFSQTILMMWDKLTDQQRRDYISIIDQQAERLSRLISNLLTLSRIERGNVVTTPSLVNVSMAVSQAMADPSFTLDTVVDVPEDLTVWCDEIHLHQVITNLLVNAERYGASPIEIEAKQSGDRVQIIISDHGEGVPDHFIPQLFERFTQGEPSKKMEAMGSTGLGLSIVVGLLEAQDGSIRYQHNEPRGASFVIELPASE